MQKMQANNLQPPNANRIVVVGSIDPQLGYDEFVNRTATFIAALKPKMLK